MVKKVLIADDEDAIVRLLEAIFDGFGEYQVMCARDGEEAIEIARLTKPDVIILDIQLPKINGYGVCRLVRSEPSLAGSKILMLSGMTQSSDWVKAQEAGADDFITKPFLPSVLMEKVTDLVKEDNN